MTAHSPSTHPVSPVPHLRLASPSHACDATPARRWANTPVDPDTLPDALYRADILRRVERACAATLVPHTLMGRAGDAVAHWLRGHLGALASAGQRPVLLLAGPGNNGGDACIAACELHRHGVAVEIWQVAPATADDARWAIAQAQAAGLTIHSLATRAQDVDGLARELTRFDWIVDGLFGIGLSRALTGDVAVLVEAVNACGRPVFAIDIPSGLLADTGMTQGPVVRADVTMAMLGATPGLLTGIGRDVAGRIEVATLGADDVLAETTSSLRVTRAATFNADLPVRHHASHKGSYGSVAIIGGADGMVGAPLLTARAGLLSGAGRVYVGFTATDHPAWDPGQPELMLRHAEALDLGAMQAMAIGPGLGTSKAAAACLAQVLGEATAADTPLVIDADALNLLATHPELAEGVRQRAGDTVLTPHPLEAARLLGTDVATVQADRPAAARTLALGMNASVVLKGSGSIVDDGSHAWINPTGNAGLASAGTGDVLTGVIASLLAQGMHAHMAALAGAWLHGRAAERCVAAGLGPAGLTASELLPAIRAELRVVSLAEARA